MKVALVLDRFDPRRGGLEHWAWQLAIWLVNHGHAVHVAAFEFGPEVTGVEKHPVPMVPGRLERAAEFERCLRELGPDLDVVHDLGSGRFFDMLHPQFGSRIAGFRQELQAFPFWRRIKARFSAKRRRRFRELRALERAQYGGRGSVIAVSQMVRRDLIRLHSVQPGRIEVIYNGVDVDRFSPAHRSVHREQVRARLGAGEKETLFLLCAHNFALKGVGTLLKAMRRLRRDGHPVRLAVTGRGKIKEFRKRARRLGVERHVTFCGEVEATEPYFAAADAYVHPTYYDPCSLTVLEAWASGLPVITSRFNGAAELMERGEHGFVLQNPGNARELARAMARLLDPDARANMGVAARALALVHSLEKNCEAIEALYRNVARQRING